MNTPSRGTLEALAADPSSCEIVAQTDVAVLFGGRSSERAVSLESGAAVCAALRSPLALGDRRGPRRLIEIEVDSSGRWQSDRESSSPATVIDRLSPDTLFFIALHGGEGENGALQGLFETCGRRYTGSGVSASALCMHKQATRLMLREAGLTVASGTLIRSFDWKHDRASAFARTLRSSTQGWYVKPNAGGSSVSTLRVERGAQAELEGAIEAVLRTGDDALVEARIDGLETTCAVLGNQGGRMRALTPVEIVPDQGRFFDYEQKYSSHGASEFCPPQNLSASTVDRVQELALRAHRAAGCDGYSRTDFLVPLGPAGIQLEPVVLEINTLPGMTSRSLLPRAALEQGLSFRDLCLEILALAVARWSPSAVQDGVDRKDSPA